jgi:AraC-like DNA-binding protein
MIIVKNAIYDTFQSDFPGHFRLSSTKSKQQLLARLILSDTKNTPMVELAKRAGYRSHKLFSLLRSIESGIVTSHPGRKPRYHGRLLKLQEKIDAYLAAHESRPMLDAHGNNLYDRNGNYVMSSKHPTMTGLALACGYSTSGSLARAARQKGEIGFMLTRARTRVLEAYEQDLQRPNCRGAIFVLSHMDGWKTSSSKSG